MKKKIFVSGASGFIGANLAKRLVLDGFEVVALLRKDSYHPFLKDIPIESVIGDVTDKSSVEKGMRGCNYVYNCAAKISFNRYDYKDCFRVNVLGTSNMLDAALKCGVERFIHMSACAVFGYSKNKIELIDEDSNFRPQPNNVYAYTKYLSENEVMKFFQRGLNAVIANPSTVYGEGDLRLNSGSLIKAIYNNKLKLAPPGGTSVISVSDLIDGLILLLHKGKAGERYIFANENIEYIELINKIASIVGKRQIRNKISKLFYYPAVAIASFIEFVNRNSTFIVPQIVKELFGYKYFSSNKSRKELGWETKIAIDVAIKNAFKFYKMNGLL